MVGIAIDSQVLRAVQYRCQFILYINKYHTFVEAPKQIATGLFAGRVNRAIARIDFIHVEQQLHTATHFLAAEEHLVVKPLLVASQLGIIAIDLIATPDGHPPDFVVKGAHAVVGTAAIEDVGSDLGISTRGDAHRREFSTNRSRLFIIHHVQHTGAGALVAAIIDGRVL